MKRHLLTLAVLAAGVVAAAYGAAPPPAPKAKVPAYAGDDRLDYLYLGSDRPVRWRFHVLVGDRPYDIRWREWSDKFFDWFDRNGDGVLQPAEAAKMTDPNQITQMLQGGIGGGSRGATQLSRVDTNRDGVVSREEFRDFYSKAGLGALRFNNNNETAVRAKQVNETLYRRLDADGDGKLSKAELANMAEALRPFDENEDEVVTREELNTEQSDYNRRFNRGMMPKASRGDETLIGYGGGRPSPEMAIRVVRRYDADKDGALSPKESGMEPAEFAALDADKNGKLTAAELSPWFAKEPELTFTVRVGPFTRVSGILDTLGFSGSRTKGRLDLMPGSDKSGATGPRSKTKKQHPDNQTVTLGDARFSVQANEGTGGRGNFNGIRVFYLNQFSVVAGDKKDVVERSKDKDFPDNPFLFSLFDAADHDGDNKLTRRELTDYLDLLGGVADAMITMDVTDDGRSLFSVLNPRNDGRLTTRQMRSAWTYTLPVAKDKAAGLSLDDLPRTLSVTIYQGQNNNRFAPNPPVSTGVRPILIGGFANGGAPAWFAKMDTNNDGDLSPKEWLGGDADFKAIDADGDGLISVEEARAYEAKKRNG